MPGKEWTIPSVKKNKPKKNKEILLIFLRAPEPGRVKTRLARDVGDEKALALYRSFVRVGLSAARDWSSQVRDREIWISYYPEDKKEMVADWLGRDYLFLAQSGRNLGQRMAGAMAKAFDRGVGKAVILGTDIPKVRPDHIEQAFVSLDLKDLVLGPSLDGGYWLIGACHDRFTPGVFKGINWGSSSVFADTIERCREYDLTWAELEPLQDVDTLADLNSIDLHE